MMPQPNSRPSLTQGDPRRTIPARNPATRYERKWMHAIEPVIRSQIAMDEFHRQGLKAFRQRGMPETIRRIVEQVATKRRVSVMLMASDSRMRIAVEARSEAMYAIKQAKPHLSSPQIAKWFARDHTSVLHALASHAAKVGLPNLAGYNIERVRRRNARIAAEMRAAKQQS
jgi:hypothetical protein